MTTTEYWVWYGEHGAEQARVIAKFDNLEECKSWCDDKLGGYYEMGRSFPQRRWADEEPQLGGIGVIGAVEDFTERDSDSTTPQRQ